MSNHLGWNYEGIDTQVALLLWAAGPGSQSLAAGRTSVSFKNSVFVEQILKVSITLFFLSFFLSSCRLPIM